MKDKEYTCETRIIPGREGEPVKVIRLNGTETMLHHIVEGEEYGPRLSYTHHFMSGPVADKLYAYEALGYSPEALKGIIDKHRRDMAWRLAINSTYGVTIPKEAVKRYVDTDRIKAMEDYICAASITPMNLMVPELSIDKYRNSMWGVFGDKLKAVANEERGYLTIKKVIFNDPATIVYWADGSKTVVKATNEKFDPEKGLAMAISKRALGDKGNYFEVFKKHIKEGKK